jgi:glycosyltransferase involved in cell wall biosynthesis
MSDQPLISVIIPAYRAAATLPRALRSLLAQTHTSWQAIAELTFLSEEPARAA